MRSPLASLSPGLVLALLASCSSSAKMPTTVVTPPAGWAGGPSGTASVAHVLLVSIDGFHSSDLERFIAAEPTSTLAKLALAGTRYTSAMAPFPSDSFPSVLAWATGALPQTTGVFYDLSYDRSLSPPGSDCSKLGTSVDFSDAVDLNGAHLNGGGGLNPALLPRDPSRGCAIVQPHQYLRVNTIFEVVKAAGLPTAWSDKHLSYEVMNGPSGAGVDDLFDPEIAAVNTKSLADVKAYDQSKVDAVVNQIHGKDHAGLPAVVPALFGMNFQAVSVFQKGAGYLDATGTPSSDLQAAIQDVDQHLGTLADELNNAGLWTSTIFIVAASHGQSPIDPTLVKRLPTSLLPGLVNDVAPGLLASATQDAVALLWLNDQTQTAAVAQHLLDNKDAAGIDHVISGPELVATYGDPATDPRVPDLFVVVKDGVIYTDSAKKVAEHGGGSADDRSVSLLVVVGGSVGQAIPQPVETRQLAPSILSALHLDPGVLQGAVKDQTAPLPGLVFTP